jgi:O-antigen ligase
VVTAGLNFVRGPKRRLTFVERIAWWKLAAIAVVVVTTGYGVATWYGQAARLGQFGERARMKYESQVRNKFGLLAGGRPEFVGGLLAISESPFVGYGSWPLDHGRVFARACDLMDVKLSPTYYKKGYPLIPSHSHVLGAWVEAGVLGIFFFFYIFGVAARAVYLPIRDENRLRFWIVSTSLLLLWAILFSPISARLETSFLLGAIFNQVVFSRAGLMSASGDRTQVATRRAA